MSKYTINSECGLMDVVADSVEAAKESYEREYHYDFDAAGEVAGSWYYVSLDGEVIEEAGDSPR